jgi:hypothetical protein
VTDDWERVRTVVTTFTDAGRLQEYDAAIADAVAYLQRHGARLNVEEKAALAELIAHLRAERTSLDLPQDASTAADVDLVARLSRGLAINRLPVVPLLYAALGIIGGLAWVVWLLMHSPGTILDDEISHVLIARDAWTEPLLILSPWGRTANTLIFMPAARFGLTAARLEAVALACIVVLLSVRLARHFSVAWPWLVPALLFFQPWFAQWSFQALTEIPFTLFMLAGWVFALEEHFLLAGLAFGILPLARHEGILLLGLWMAFAVLRRRWMGLLGAVIPLVVYNAVAYKTAGFLPASIYFDPTPTDFYGHGGWSHYVRPLLDGIGVPVAVLAVLGIPAMLRHWPGRLFVAWNAIYIAMQVVFFKFGLFASGGYIVFLLPVAPLAAIMAAHGLSTLVTLVSRQAGYRRAPVAAAGALAAATIFVIAAASSAMPIPEDTYQTSLIQAVDLIHSEGLDQQPVVTQHVWVDYLYPLPVSAIRAYPHSIDALPTGTVLVWDSRYADDWGWDLTGLSDPKNGWRSVAQFGRGTAEIFHKT